MLGISHQWPRLLRRFTQCFAVWPLLLSEPCNCPSGLLEVVRELLVDCVRPPFAPVGCPSLGPLICKFVAEIVRHAFFADLLLDLMSLDLEDREAASRILQGAFDGSPRASMQALGVIRQFGHLRVP